MVRAAATRQSLEAAVAVARTAVAATAATSAEVGSLPGGWGVGKPMGGESRGWLREGGCVLLVLLPTPLASCRCCMRTLEFQVFLTSLSEPVDSVKGGEIGDSGPARERCRTSRSILFGMQAARVLLSGLEGACSGWP
eukprot:scaffold10794_cov66-Phaeocystis_antarctica.AAC.3